MSRKYQGTCIGIPSVAWSAFAEGMLVCVVAEVAVGVPGWLVGLSLLGILPFILFQLLAVRDAAIEEGVYGINSGARDS